MIIDNVPGMRKGQLNAIQLNADGMSLYSSKTALERVATEINTIGYTNEPLDAGNNPNPRPLTLREACNRIVHVSFRRYAHTLYPHKLYFGGTREWTEKPPGLPSHKVTEHQVAAFTPEEYAAALEALAHDLIARGPSTKQMVGLSEWHMFEGVGLGVVSP